MADEVEKLAKRVDELENKLRMTFMEVEHRFDVLREKHREHDLETRLIEIEDLLLLLQLEVTKIRDMAGVSVDIGLTPDTPPLGERLNRLEHEMSSITNKNLVSGPVNEEIPEEKNLFDENKEKEEPVIQKEPVKKKRETDLLDDVNKILGLKVHA